MHLDTLRVLHLPKKQVGSFEPSIEDAQSVFYINTCQRWVWVWNSEQVKSCPIDHSLIPVGTELLKGQDAYRFLIRLAAALESEVLGETDIFGQVKEAWRKASQSNDFFELGPWIQRVFEDTKEIRTRYLQNLGGSSYGTLVRKILKDQQGVDEGPILISGAGQIAQSIAPLLLDAKICLANRNLGRLLEFQQNLSVHANQGIQICDSLESEEYAWKTAAHVIVCTPIDKQRDSVRLAWFKQGGAENRSIIHLGGLRAQCQPAWNLPRFFCLDDLFSLQSSLGKVRSVQIAFAEKACEERAHLRAMGASISIPHGWEDLACFA